jgi:hypothetical protein
VSPACGSSQQCFPLFTLPEVRYPVRLNVARELLDKNAEGDRGHRPAVVFGDRVLTYGELARRVSRRRLGTRLCLACQQR